MGVTVVAATGLSVLDVFVAGLRRLDSTYPKGAGNHKPE